MGYKSKEPIRIAVMGVTGSGKSTFIQRASKADVGIGHSLSSCMFTLQQSKNDSRSRLTALVTFEVTDYKFELDGHKITLIDTPGFNDTVRSEAEVLRDIANYMDSMYRNPPKEKLHGIIYLQSIQDPRMYGSSLRNLKMFKDLCGESPLKNVVLVTNRWEEARSLGQEEQASKKEVELRNRSDFWQPLLERGSEMVRCEDTHESAINIIRKLISKSPEVLQIQTELVTQDKKLIDTKAGTAVNEEAIRAEKKYQADLAQIRKEIDEARASKDLEVQEALEHSKKDYERKLDKILDDQQLLRYEERNEKRRMQNILEGLQAELKLREVGAQNVSFDEAAARLMANLDKIRAEQRPAVQAEVNAMKKKPKEKRTGAGLVMGVVQIVGSAALSAMGIPMGFVGPLWSLLKGRSSEE